MFSNHAIKLLHCHSAYYLFDTDDDLLTVCCGQPGAVGKHVFLKVATEMALAEFEHLSLCLPKNPEKFVLKLLSVSSSQIKN